MGVSESMARGWGMAHMLDNDARKEQAVVRQFLKDTTEQFGTLIENTPEEFRPAIIDSAMRQIEGKVGVKLSPLMRDLFKKNPGEFFRNVSFAMQNGGENMSMEDLKQVFGNEQYLMPLAVGIMKARHGDKLRNIALGTDGPQPAGPEEAPSDGGGTDAGGPDIEITPGNMPFTSVRMTQGDITGTAPAAPASGAPPKVPALVAGQVKREQSLNLQLQDLMRREEAVIAAGGEKSPNLEFLRKRMEAIRSDIDRMTSNELRAMIAATGGDPNAPTPAAIIKAQEALIDYKGRTAYGESFGRESGQIDAEYNKPLPVDFVAQHRLPPGTTLRDLMNMSGNQPSAPAATVAPAPTATTATGAAPAVGAGSAAAPAAPAQPGRRRVLLTPGEIEEERKERGGIGDFQAKRFEDIIKTGDAAREERSRLQILARLAPQINTGKLVGPAQEWFYQAAQSWGYNAKNLGIIETFNSITNDLTSKMVKRLPGALSEKELTFIEGIPPSVKKSPAANKAIIEMMTKVADRQEYVSRRAQQWVDQYGTLTARTPQGQNFWDVLRVYTDTNPLLADEMQNSIFKPQVKGGIEGQTTGKGSKSKTMGGIRG